MVDGYFKKLEETSEEEFKKLWRERELAQKEALEAKKQDLEKKFEETPSVHLQNQIAVLERDIIYQKRLMVDEGYALYCKNAYGEYKKIKKKSIELQNQIDLIEDEKDEKRKKFVQELNYLKREEESAKREAEIDLRGYLDSQVRPWTLSARELYTSFSCSLRYMRTRR
jgi:hypothetical protein